MEATHPQRRRLGPSGDERGHDRERRQRRALGVPSLERGERRRPLQPE